MTSYLVFTLLKHIFLKPLLLDPRIKQFFSLDAFIRLSQKFRLRNFMPSSSSYLKSILLDLKIALFLVFAFTLSLILLYATFVCFLQLLEWHFTPKICYCMNRDFDPLEQSHREIHSRQMQAILQEIRFRSVLEQIPLGEVSVFGAFRWVRSNWVMTGREYQAQSQNFQYTAYHLQNRYNPNYSPYRITEATPANWPGAPFVQPSERSQSEVSDQLELQQILAEIFF